MGRLTAPKRRADHGNNSPLRPLEFAVIIVSWEPCVRPWFHPWYWSHLHFMVQAMTAPRPGARPKAPDGEPLRFASLAVMFEGSQCLEWPYGKTEGYGALWFNGRKVGVHNLVLSAWDGPQPEGKEACHSCDNRACINPTHLRWGTRQDNVDDMMKRGRQWKRK